MQVNDQRSSCIVSLSCTVRYIYKVLGRIALTSTVCISPFTHADVDKLDHSIIPAKQKSTIEPSKVNTNDHANSAAEQTASVVPQVDYVYDDLGRLTQVKHQGVVVTDYQLDDMSNRITRSTTKQP